MKDTIYDNDDEQKEYLGPNNDPDVTDTVGEELIRWRDKLMPYHRYIMIGGIIILIMLVVFLGFAYGGMRVCSDLDGILDSSFKCHPYYYNDTITIDEDAAKYLLGNITFEEQDV